MDPYIERLNNKPLKHLVIDGSGRIPIDHAEEIKTASNYYGSWLIAKKPINIYSSPGGTIEAVRNTGQTIGRIYSHVTRNGEVWWMLYNDGGFVKHEKGAFDTSIVNTTASGPAHEKNVQEQIALANKPDVVDKVTAGISDAVGGAGSALSGFGKNLNMIIILVLIAAIGITFFKLNKL